MVRDMTCVFFHSPHKFLR